MTHGVSMDSDRVQEEPQSSSHTISTNSECRDGVSEAFFDNNICVTFSLTLITLMFTSFTCIMNDAIIMVKHHILKRHIPELPN